MEIDLVYMWVDGNDQSWIDKKNAYLDSSVKKLNLAGRYQDNNEFKYSLRSISKYAPWLRKIFIITDSQIPKFIDTSHPKIQIVDHKDIIPSNVLPTFNTAIIDHFIHKIPGLSEHFLLSNDDCFINKPISKSFFFKDNRPIIKLLESDDFFKKINLKKFIGRYVCTYHRSVLKSSKLIKRKFNKEYKYRPHHNIDAYLKSDYKKTNELFLNDLKPTFANRFRKNNDIQRILYDFYSLANDNAILKEPTDQESLLISVNDSNYSELLKKYNPSLFCLNDNEQATDDDRKRVEPFLRNLLPEKSLFEL